MKTVVLAIAAALPLAAVAAVAASDAASEPSGFHARLYQRYCDKLREGPEAYVQFVRRLQPVHGLTYSDFAPERRGDPVVADCRVVPERAAAVHQLLRKRDS